MRTANASSDKVRYDEIRQDIMSPPKPPPAATSNGEVVDEQWELSLDLVAYQRRYLGDDSAIQSSFIGSEEFMGKKKGMVYRLGSLGLGYYEDVRGKAWKEKLKG